MDATVDLLPEEAMLTIYEPGLVHEPEIDNAPVFTNSTMDTNLVSSTTRARPRIRNAATPTVVTQVHRSPCFNNDGFMHVPIPDRTPRRRSSSVPRATAPSVMQLDEM